MGEQPLVVVMGISGVGKSAVGHELADRFSLDYADGDDFHSEANIAKMSAGTPLTDEDRWPWLADIGALAARARRRRRGHQLLGAQARLSRRPRRRRPRTYFLHLTGDHDLIKSRMEHRDHFMPASLLESQEKTLEPLQDDENGWAFDITPSPAEIVDAFVARAGLAQEDTA